MSWNIINKYDVQVHDVNVLTYDEMKRKCAYIHCRYTVEKLIHRVPTKSRFDVHLLGRNVA